MERADLLEANGAIFKPQGEAINAHAADDIKVLVVGNPANTNALIAQSNAPDVPRRALHRDDAAGPEPRRTRSWRTSSARRSPTSRTSSIWGNHSPTMFPDLFNAKVKGKNAVEVVDDMAWYENDYMPNVGKRGAAIIEARGASAAASAANAAIDHVHDWVLGRRRPASRWRSRPTAPTASTRASSPASRCASAAAPTRSSQGLEVGEFAQSKIDITVDELERGARRRRQARPGLVAAAVAPGAPRAGRRARSGSASSGASPGPPCGPGRPSARPGSTRYR